MLWSCFFFFVIVALLVVTGRRVEQLVDCYRDAVTVACSRSVGPVHNHSRVEAPLASGQATSDAPGECYRTWV